MRYDQKSCRIAFFTMLVILIWGLMANTFGQPPKKVLIVPFALNTSEDIAFLKKGIAEKLSADFSQNGQIAVNIDPQTIRKQLQKKKYQTPLPLPDAIRLGEQEAADFVVSGSQTLFDDTISTSATCIDVAKQKIIVTYHQVSRQKGDILNHLQVFCKQAHDAMAGLAAPSSQSISSTKEAAPADIWTSDKIDSHIIALTVGDTDGDGKNETVLSSADKLFIYRFTDGKLHIIKEIPEPDYKQIISIDTADINQNGKSEIFVNAIQRRSGRVVSYVIEFNKNTYNKILDEQNWHYRVIRNGRQLRLMGQIGKNTTNPVFTPGIFELGWQRGAYEVIKKLDLPQNIEIYGFNQGAILNNGSQQTIAISADETVVIYNQDGKPEWASTEKYGGCETFLEYPSEMERDEKANHYLKQRILIDDLNHDNQTDIILVKSEEISGRLFARYRSYNKGHLECLIWTKLGLQKSWETQEVPGYISDFGLYDIDQDGQKELVYSVIAKSSFFFGDKTSHLVSQKIP